jgi:hypothetical protein
MDGEAENQNDQHQESEGSSEQIPLTTENLATHDSEPADSHDSGSSNDHENQNPADPTLEYTGSQVGNGTATTTTTTGNLQHDDTPMQRWQLSNDDRPPFWLPDEKKDEDNQGDGTK